MKFTVVLRYPEYAAEDWPNEMSIVYISNASNYRKAIKLARLEACRRCDHPVGDPSDFVPIVTIAGHVKFPQRADLVW